MQYLTNKKLKQINKMWDEMLKQSQRQKRIQNSRSCWGPAAAAGLLLNKKQITNLQQRCKEWECVLSKIKLTNNQEQKEHKNHSQRRPSRTPPLQWANWARSTRPSEGDATAKGECWGMPKKQPQGSPRDFNQWNWKTSINRCKVKACVFPSSICDLLGQATDKWCHKQRVCYWSSLHICCTSGASALCHPMCHIT